MPNTYSFEPINLVRDEQGIVKSVNFWTTVSDGTESFTFEGFTGLPAPKDEVIDYDKLTPEIVAGWIESLVGEAIKKQADNELAAFYLRKQQKISGVPW